MEKRIPRRRFKEFVGSGDWEEKKFGDIFPTIKSGNRLPKDLLKEGNIPYVIATVENNGVFMKIDKNTLDYHGNNMKLFEAPSITFSIDNPDAIFLQEQAFFTSNIMRVLNNEDLSKNEYIFFLELLRKLTGGFDWSIKFSGPVVLNLDIRIPYDRERKNINYKEIQKIGDFFQKLDRLIEINKDKLDKLKASKSAYLTEMFPREGEDRPRRRFQGFTGVWEEKKLGEVGITFNGLSGKSKKDFGHGQAEFITYLNVFHNTISDIYGTDNVEIDDRQNQVKYGDIFFTTSSETPEEVGMSSVWIDNRPNVYLNSFCFGYRLLESINIYYIAYLLRSPSIRKEFQLLAQGISRYNISKTKAMDINIPIPSLAEQEKIGNFFQKLDQQIEVQEEKLEKLEKMKKAYLAEMFV